MTFLVAARLIAKQRKSMEGPTVLRVARMLDVATGEMLDNGVLVVRSGRIEASTLSTGGT